MARLSRGKNIAGGSVGRTQIQNAHWQRRLDSHDTPPPFAGSLVDQPNRMGIAESQPTRDPVIGMSEEKITPEMARESLNIYLEQLSIQGLLHVRDYARDEVAREEIRAERHNG